MSGKDRDLLIEASASAFRERDPAGRIVPSPAWWDLSPQDRDAAFALQLASRRLERLVDPQGQSTTARAVLARARRLGQMERGDDKS